MNPAQYNPLAPEDFIGSARDYALLLRQGILRARASGDAPLRYLINGPPGIGKSQLVKFALYELGVSPWSIISRSGTAVGIEEMQVIEESVRLRDLFGYRAIVIEEADQISQKAQIRWLDISDKLPAGNAVFFTGNQRVDHFEERFQRRFQVFELTRPSTAEIAELLKRWIAPVTAQQIAHDCKGCVGSALLDAQTALDHLAAQAA